MIEFKEFPKIPRLNRECIISEKIDGTNACVVVSDWGEVAAQSRNQLLVGDIKDNFGFRNFVETNKNFLRDTLGVGHHFGEWWGKGIQRGYDRTRKIFSLFNVDRWKDLPLNDVVTTVPVLYQGLFSTDVVNSAVAQLRLEGSMAAPGFMKPEGIVVFHIAANSGFKVTLEKDEHYKSQSL